jgi:hypothetical protein
MNAAYRLATSEYGTKLPQILITGASHFRASRALAFRLAAKIEELSQALPRCGWVVQIGDFGGADARVELELSHGDDAEVAVASSVLEAALLSLGTPRKGAPRTSVDV